MMDTSDQDPQPSPEESPPPPPPAMTDWVWPAYPSDLAAHAEAPAAEPAAEPAAPEEAQASDQQLAAESPEPGPSPPPPLVVRLESPASDEVGEGAPPEDPTLPMPAIGPAPPEPSAAAPPLPVPAEPRTGPPPPPPTWGAPYGWGPPPGRPAGRRRRGWIIALALLATAAVAAASLTALGADLLGGRGSVPAATGGTGGTAQSAPAQRGGGQVGQVDPGPAATQVLAARADAVLHHNRAAFLRTIDRRRTTFYRAQAALYDRMVTVPFSALEYQVSASGQDLATARVRRRYAPSPVYLPEVEASYRFRGQDSTPVTSHYFYTFALTPAGWRLAGQGDLPAPLKDDVEIWDSSPVRTLASARTLIVYHRGDRALAERLLAAAERGYGQVDASWSGLWEHSVVILVPSGQEEAERLVHGRDLSDAAAVSASQVEAGAAHRVLGNRVIVNTSFIRRYNQLNLQIVITHEMTHVATRNVGVGVPLFLVEGFADYTALRPVDAPLRITRPLLAAAVRGGHFKGTLPSDEEILGHNGALAYDEASSFCLWLARSFGREKLQTLYFSFAGTEEPTAEVVDQRLREELGISLATAQSRWASFVRRAL